MSKYLLSVEDTAYYRQDYEQAIPSAWNTLMLPGQEGDFADSLTLSVPIKALVTFPVSGFA